MKKLSLILLIFVQAISLNASIGLNLTGKSIETFKSLPLSVQQELRPYVIHGEKTKSEQTSSSTLTNKNLAKEAKASSLITMDTPKLLSMIEEALFYPQRNEGLNRLRKYVLGKNVLNERERVILLDCHLSNVRHVLQTLDHRLFPEIPEIVQLVLPGWDLVQDHARSIEETIVHYFEQVLFYDMPYEVIERVFNTYPIDVDCESFTLTRPIDIDYKGYNGCIENVKKFKLNYCIDCSDEDFYKLCEYKPFCYKESFLGCLRKGKLPLEARVRLGNRDKIRKLVSKNRHGLGQTTLPDAAEETSVSTNSASINFFEGSDFIQLILDCLHARKPLTDLTAFITIHRTELLAKFKTLTIGDRSIPQYLRRNFIFPKKRTEVKAILHQFILAYDLEQSDFIRLIMDCLDSKRPVTDLVSFVRIHKGYLLHWFKALEIGDQTLREYLHAHSESKEKGSEVMAALEIFICDEKLLSFGDRLARSYDPTCTCGGGRLPPY